MWQRFTQKARSIVFQAQKEAESCSSDSLSPQHLLLAILARRDTVGARVLDRMKVDFSALETAVRAATPKEGGRTSADMQLTSDAHRSVDFAYFEAKALSDNYIGTEHLMLGLICEASSGAARALATAGIDLEKARQSLAELRANVPPPADSTWTMFTEGARRAVFLAQEEAGRFGQQAVSTEHLLLGLLRDDNPFTEAGLRCLGVSRDAIRAAVDDLAPRGDSSGGAASQTSPGLMRAINLAREEVLAVNRHYVGIDFLLIGLIREGDGIAARVLGELGVTLQAARDAAEAAWSTGLPQSAPADETGTGATPSDSISDRSNGSLKASVTEVPRRSIMWQRFTERARRVVFFAQQEAGKRLFSTVDTEHLLLGMLRDEDSVAMRVLDSLSIDAKALQAEVLRQAPVGEKLEQGDMQLTSASKRAIDLAYEEAQRLKNNYIGTEHLLMGLLREEQGIAAQQLSAYKIELAALRVSVAAFQEARALAAAHEAALETSKEKTESATVERLSESAQRIVRFAQYEARELGENYYSTEHLLLGLLREDSDGTTEILQRLGLTPETVKSTLMRQVSRGEGIQTAAEVAPTPRVKRVIDIAQRTAAPFGDVLIGPEHLLMGLINEGEGLAGRVLLSFGINPQNAMNAFRAARPSESKISAESKLTSLEAQLEALRQRLERLPGGPAASPTRAEPEVPVPSPLFGDLGIARPMADRTQIEVAHDAAAFRKLLAVFQAKDAYGYRSLTDGDQTVFLLPGGTRLKLLVPPPESDDLFEEGHHVRVLEGDYAGYAGWIVKDAFQRTGFDAAVFPPAD